MQRSFLAFFLAASLTAAALVFSTDTARADRPRRGYGPVVVVAPARPAYYRYYGGPPPGRYGSPYYGMAVNRIFGYPATYVPYGSRVASGYAYPMGYSDAYGTYGPPAGDWDPYSNPLLQATMIENQLRWGTALPPHYPEARTRRRVHRSTPEQQAKSVHAQTQGDVWMKQLRFLNGYERYKVAQSAASDRPEPYFRLGFSLTAVGNYDSAIKYFKQGLDLDPQWPAHGDRLDTLFGEDNRLSVLSMISRVGGWVREDIRDPDRLFLMGVILHFDGDTRASEFFEAAYRLSGQGDHLLAFLHPAGGPGGPVSPGPDLGGGNWNGPTPGAPVFNGPGGNAPVFNGQANGGTAAPLPQEPQEGPPQMVAPPDFGPGGRPQGLFSPQQAPPRGLYQPLPQRPRQTAPQNSRPRTAPSQVIPQRAEPQQGPPQQEQPPQVPPQQVAPPKVAPKPATPAVPALPVPPLPAPEEPEPQTGTQNGPSLDGPALAPPAGSASGSTTAQSP
ncbi:MAG TPA: tetratricopeptide repeat protein [Planctomycetaceae bacterium]|jgi:hypothetical protein|nr:tetratricopeptide repeat protein [Planctomycetaceae bacterium]